MLINESLVPIEETKLAEEYLLGLEDLCRVVEVDELSQDNTRPILLSRIKATLLKEDIKATDIVAVDTTIMAAAVTILEEETIVAEDAFEDD